jgi:DNA-binding CsgD family transcriptional regulator
VLVFLKEFNGTVSPIAAVPDEFIRYFNISPREKEIIDRLMEGSAYKQIGDILFISPRTVESHVYRIFKKCGVSNKIELINLILSHT